MRKSTPAYIKINCCAEKALEVFAEANPNELTSLSDINVFIQNGEYFYPVTGMEIQNSDGGSVDLTVNPYSFCKDPRHVKTPVNGETLIKYKAASSIESITCNSLKDKQFDFNPYDEPQKIFSSKCNKRQVCCHNIEHIPGCIIFCVWGVRLVEEITERSYWARTQNKNLDFLK